MFKYSSCDAMQCMHVVFVCIHMCALYMQYCMCTHVAGAIANKGEAGDTGGMEAFI